MKELVELLKQARQDKQVSLEEISNQSKIQIRYLEALESGEFSIFAGEVYLKGVICNYAELVGLESKEVIALYHRLKRGDPADTAKEPPEHQSKPAKAAKQIRYFRIGPSLRPGVVVLALLLLIGVIWFFNTRERAAVDPDPPENVSDVDNETGEATPGDAEAEPEPEPDPVSAVDVVLQNTSGGETSYYVYGTDTLEMHLVFFERCWIELYVDGTMTARRNFLRDEELPITALGSVRIRMGYPRGVSLTIAGNEIAELQQYSSSHNFLFILEEH